MNNEELKKKIVEIINDGIIHGEDNFGMPTSKTIENIADALIAAGMGEVETVRKISIAATKVAILEAAKAEHRAAIAERALRDELVQKAIRLGVIDIRPWYIQALNEAEKKIAEERE